MAGISKVRIKYKSGKEVYKYRVTYRDITGKQHTSPYYDTRKKAQEELYKYEKVNPKSVNLTIGQMFSLYMEHAESKYSYTTNKDTETYIRNFFKDIYEVKYDRITSFDLERFINKIAAEHTPQVANQALKKANAVFNYCIKHGVIKENKIKAVAKFKVENKPHAHLTIGELKEVLNNCRELFPKYYPLLYTLIGSGMRIGEALALNKEDVHFGNGYNYIHVSKQYTKDTLLQHTKTKAIRDVVIFDDLAEVLNKHINHLPEDCDLLFPNNAGAYQNPSNIRNRVWKPLLFASGINKRVRMHDLRGSYIDMLLSNGVSVKFAQAQAGHSKAQTTLDIYARNNEDMKNNAMEVLNAKFTKQNKM